MFFLDLAFFFSSDDESALVSLEVRVAIWYVRTFGGDAVDMSGKGMPYLASIPKLTRSFWEPQNR